MIDSNSTFIILILNRFLFLFITPALRCFLGVPSCEKCRIQVSPVPACGINDDLFACGYECRFSSIECSCVVLYKFEGDKGVSNPEGLIWESNCEEKVTIVTLTGGEKQLTMDWESFRNHTIAKIAGQLNGEKENMRKAYVRKGLGDGLAMRLPLSKPREID
ncbi:hypothetical protein TNCV_777601 [Trichonephila clavipes]|nr:hypothetical protein TNCV_777601 [Trichonephila clavipes]